MHEEHTDARRVATEKAENAHAPVCRGGKAAVELPRQTLNISIKI